MSSSPAAEACAACVARVSMPEVGGAQGLLMDDHLPLWTFTSPLCGSERAVRHNTPARVHPNPQALPH
jgi:hypothetical protein